MAALVGTPALALGNALGSNIVNTSLILVVTALVAPIMAHSRIVRSEPTLLLLVAALAALLLWDNGLRGHSAWLVITATGAGG